MEGEGAKWKVVILIMSDLPISWKFFEVHDPEEEVMGYRKGRQAQGGAHMLNLGLKVEETALAVDAEKVPSNWG